MHCQRLVVLLALQSGCLTASVDTGAPATTTGAADLLAEIEALKARLDDAEQTISELGSANAAMEAQLAALPTDIATEDYVDTAVNQVATWVGDQGYLTSGDLAAYATSKQLDAVAATIPAAYGDKEVGAYLAGYLPGNYYTETEVDDLLAPYATTAWVTDQGYVTETWVDANYTTDADVAAAVSAAGTYGDAEVGAYLAANDYATELYVDGAVAGVAYGDTEVAAYLTSNEYATESYVDAVQADVDALSSEVDALDAVSVVSTDQAYDIPGDFADLNEGIAWLETVLVPAGVTVTFNLKDATYALYAPVYAPVRNGSSLEILGAGSGATTVNLVGTDGFVAEPGTTFGLIDGLTLAGDNSFGQEGVAAWDGYIEIGSDVVITGIAQYGSGSAVLARRNGVVLASSVAVSDSDIAFAASEGGVVVADHSTANGVLSAGRYGFHTSTGGILLAEGAVATGIDCGFEAEYGGQIHARESAAMDSVGDGYLALEGSFIDAEASNAQSSGDAGFNATGGGFIRAPDATADDNYQGFHIYGGRLQAPGASATGNAAQGFNCDRGGTCYLNEAYADGNGSQGFAAGNGATLVAESATASGNVQEGFRTWVGSVLVANDAIATGNGTAGFGSHHWSLVWTLDSSATSNSPDYEADVATEGYLLP